MALRPPATPVDTYSTNEVQTGKVWINGKTIYRKVVYLGAMPNNTVKTVAHGIIGTFEIVNARGIFENASGRGIIPYAHNTSPLMLFVDKSGKVTIVASGDWSSATAHAILEYTKG